MLLVKLPPYTTKYYRFYNNIEKDLQINFKKNTYFSNKLSVINSTHVQTPCYSRTYIGTGINSNVNVFRFGGAGIKFFHPPFHDYCNYLFFPKPKNVQNAKI